MSIKISSGFFGLLTILFIALKLTHVIAWSWVWVLSPLWIPAALSAAGIILALVVALGVMLFMKLFMVDIMKVAKQEKKPAEKNVTE